MALSPAMQWALNNGMSEADVYKNINDFLATNPTAAQSQSQMAQFGISPEDVAAATGGKSGGLLSGNILAGASWNSTNTALQNALTEATGQQTSNYAVGGSTTTDTLNQLNTFLAGGGQFDPNATVYLQAGGVDFIQGVDKGVVKDNLNQIVKTLGDQGVNVVLTGSPYAKSIDDVVNNNFDPKVDQIYNDVAKANSNVALVGTQGEILQNKKLLVDALHTNAEGTAIYNQSVIDALSQFKNEVPSSTPQAIAAVQKTNTVATTPPVITQAAASPVVAQTLARAIPTARGTVIEGDDIEEQIAGVPQVVYETRVDPNNTANWQTVNPKTGEVIDSGTFAGGGDQGLLRAAAPVIGLAASTVGLPFITNLLSGATGLTGSALSGATGATIGAGTQAVTGGSAEDIARAALLGGGASYLGNALSNLDVPVDFNNMTADELNDALQTNLVKDLKQAGAATPQEFLTGQGANAGNFIQESVAASNIANNLSAQGLNSGEIAQLLDSAGFVPTAITDALDSLAVVAPVAVSTPVTDGGTVAVTAPNTSLSNVLSTIASTTPAVTVTAPKTPQVVDQAVLDLVNSQLAANVTTPTTLPTAEQVVTSNRPVTNQDIVNSIVASLPTTTPTTPVAQQTITAQKPTTVQEVVNAITASIPAVTTPTTTPTQTITAQKPATAQEVVNAITATLPTVTPTQAATIAEQVVTSNRPVTTQEVINAITAALPTIPAVTTPVVPEQVVTAQKPSSITDAVTAATIPLIQPSTPLTVPQVTAQTTTPPVDPLKVAQLGLTAAGLLGAGTAISGGGSTQFPIVPVPDTFLTPTAPAVATYPQLPAINFGDRNLLRGTQWEKFLDPNYGQVPAPVQYSQPSNLSYNDLMGILGSRQGMPARSSLSINDIISGIQNQYGQANRSSMG